MLSHQSEITSRVGIQSVPFLFSFVFHYDEQIPVQKPRHTLPNFPPRPCKLRVTDFNCFLRENDFLSTPESFALNIKSAPSVIWILCSLENLSFIYFIQNIHDLVEAYCDFLKKRPEAKIASKKVKIVSKKVEIAAVCKTF